MLIHTVACALDKDITGRFKARRSHRMLGSIGAAFMHT
jgi:hypothetical protein